MNCSKCGKEAMPNSALCGVCSVAQMAPPEDKYDPLKCLNCGRECEAGIQVVRKLLSDEVVVGSVCDDCSNAQTFRLTVRREADMVFLDSFLRT